MQSAMNQPGPHAIKFGPSIVAEPFDDAQPEGQWCVHSMEPHSGWIELHTPDGEPLSRESACAIAESMVGKRSAA